MGVRTYSGKPRIYLDMDGVVADFDTEAKIRGVGPKELKAIRGVYRTLQLIPGASEGVFSLLSMGWEIFFLSKPPSDNTSAATDKLDWVNDWFPMIGERVIITPDKGCVGTARDYLVDDHPDWANAHNFPGTIVHYGSETVKNWTDVVAFFREQLHKKAA